MYHYQTFFVILEHAQYQLKKIFSNTYVGGSVVLGRTALSGMVAYIEGGRPLCMVWVRFPFTLHTQKDFDQDFKFRIR